MSNNQSIHPGNCWHYPKTILASQSPRRRELLRQIGVPHQVVYADIDESWLSNEKPEVYVQRVALSKAQAGWHVTREEIPDHCLPVLAADTCVVLDNAVLGKPKSQAHARDMLRSLSGKTHQVMTSVAMVTANNEATPNRTPTTVATNRESVILSVSQVTFREISESEMATYWHTGEPVDKAGGYAIQGLGATFVQRLEGSYSGVMGLPLFETAALLRQLGYN